MTTVLRGLPSGAVLVLQVGDEEKFKSIWVGMQGGTVTPYSLAGAVLGASFQPFANIPDTIDGLTFQGEGSQTRHQNPPRSACSP